MRAALRAVAGVLLAGAGLAALAEVALALAGAGPLLPLGPWSAAAARARLGQPAVLAAAGALLAAGLLLLAARAAGARRERRADPGWGRAPLGPEAGPGRWWIGRRSAEHYAAEAVLRATTATAASARLEPGPDRGSPWQLVLNAAGPATARAEVERRAGAALARLGAPAGSAVKVRYRGWGR